MAAVANMDEMCSICLGSFEPPHEHTHELACKHCPLCRAAFSQPHSSDSSVQIMSQVEYDQRANYIVQQYQKNPTIFTPALGRAVKSLKIRRKELKDAIQESRVYEKTDEFQHVYKKSRDLQRKITRAENKVWLLESKVAAYPVAMMFYEIKNNQT
jgi:hypothetical protein